RCHDRRPGAAAASAAGTVAGERGRHRAVVRTPRRHPRTGSVAVARDRAGGGAGPLRCRPRCRRVHDWSPPMSNPVMNTTNPRLPIHAATGTELTARSWQTEAPLRMLMNNLDPENAERPEALVVYGGHGK